jgi:hypothetical protein
MLPLMGFGQRAVYAVYAIDLLELASSLPEPRHQLFPE